MGGRWFQDLLGQTFGHLTVVGDAPPFVASNGSRRAAWRCRCACGVECVARATNLRSGTTKSCGCLRSTQTAARNVRHGGAVRAAISPTYRTWSRMIQRCEDATSASFADYGGRGIAVCARWRGDFAAFLADMGERPAGMSIDRIDNDGGYWCGHCEKCAENVCPPNCRWATPSEQSRNRRSNRLLTCHGRTMTLAEWAAETGMAAEAISQRLSRLGWTMERALCTPTRKTQRRAPTRAPHGGE